MISKRIHCKVENDNYRRLANYIADASHAGEKSLMHWCAGTWAGDDYDLAIQEVQDTQSLNTRTIKEKSYHLMISFRPEDEGKLSHDDFKAIEKRFAQVLGFSNHQRHCGVHINTDNMHMHIAYNMIHPDSFARHEPYRDYRARDRLCRELEKEYNITIDNGIDPLRTDMQLSDNSAKTESLKGEESFERYAMNNHGAIMEIIDKAQTWEDVHHAVGLYGMELKPKGNGLILKNRKGRQAVKASTFDRSISYNKLVKRLGIFTPCKNEVETKETRDWYRKTPLQYNAHQNMLWNNFIKEARQKEIAEIKAKWLKEKIRITGLVVSRRAQSNIMQMAKNKEKMEINQVRTEHGMKTENWLEFLRERANNGDEDALDVLRCSKEKDPVIYAHAFGKYRTELEEKQELLTHKDTILNKYTIENKTKKLLYDLTVMKTVAPIAKHKITRNGTIIFTLENGGKIMDDGRKISFTQEAKEIAIDYATTKWGIKKLTPNEKELIKESSIAYRDIEHVKKVNKQQALEKKNAIQKQKEINKQTVKKKQELQR